MSEVNEKCLESFPLWLESLGNDLKTMASVLKSEGLGQEAKAFLLGAVNYLFKSLDLIPDGIEDIGYLDDAFVIRLSAKAAVEGDLGEVAPSDAAKLDALAKDAVLIEDFLGEGTYARLDKYSRNLANGAARGRMVLDMMTDSGLMNELLGEAETFIAEFTPPSFEKDEKTLIKLAAFFDAKLPT